MSASACAKPTTIASRRVSVVDRRARGVETFSATSSSEAEHDQRRADDVEVARAVLDLVAERERRRCTIGTVPTIEVPAHPRVELACGATRSRSDASQARAIRHRSRAEVQDDGGHRAELDDRRERGAGVLPADEGRDDAQVAAARDRQELGQPLDDAQDDGLEEIH